MKGIHISKPDGSCRRPMKDSKVLRNSGFPWVLGFLSYRSSLSYLHWLPGSLDCWLPGSPVPWLPGCLAPWFPCSLAVWLAGSLNPGRPGSLASWPWLPSSWAPGRRCPREAGNAPAGGSGGSKLQGPKTHGTAATELCQWGGAEGNLFSEPPHYKSFGF